MRGRWLIFVCGLAGCGGGGAGVGASGGGGGGGGTVGAGGAGDAGPPPQCSASGAWQAAGQSDVGRYAPGVAALASGEVIIAGGWDATNGVTKTALLFDPASSVASPGGALSWARNFPAVAAVPGGFLFAGGFNDALGSMTRADVYDEGKGAFAMTGNMKEARELFSATALPDGRVVVMGGLSAVGLVVRSTAEIYDPVSGTFAEAGTLLHPRFGQATLYVPATGKVLVVGGKTTTTGGDIFIPEAEWYDPTTGSFAPAGTLAHARDRATADFLPDGRILVAGGSNATDGTLSSTEVFDPATSTFTGGPPMTTRRMAHTTTRLADGRIVVVGGWSDSTTPSASSSTAEVFDPTPMAFQALPPLTAARHDHAAPRLGSCGVLVVGGTQVVQGGATVTPLGFERIDLASP